MPREETATVKAPLGHLCRHRFAVVVEVAVSYHISESITSQQHPQVVVVIQLHRPKRVYLRPNLDTLVRIGIPTIGRFLSDHNLYQLYEKKRYLF